MSDICYPPRGMSTEEKRAFIISCAVDSGGTVADTVRTDQQNESSKMKNAVIPMLPGRREPLEHLRELCALPHVAARVFERLDADRIKYNERLRPYEYVPEMMAAFYGKQCRTFWEEVCLGEWGLASTYPGYEWMFRLSLPEGVAEYVDSVRRYCYDEASEWVFGVNGGAGGRRAVTSMELRVLRQTEESSMAVLRKMVAALHEAAGDE